MDSAFSVSKMLRSNSAGKEYLTKQPFVGLIGVSDVKDTVRLVASPFEEFERVKLIELAYKFSGSREVASIDKELSSLVKSEFKS